jgi:primosomal protein N' (replication factor Y)
MGFGTQKIEKELSELFPEARILRMDADTTSTKFAYEEILGKFREGRADILIGTQMVAKGHDFPNVTLSAVLSADSALYLDDYHASERTFSMICQLVGRAGRASKPGRALIQTYNPDHPVVMMAASQDYDSFYKNEIALRRALIFPPFCDIALITVISEDESAVLLASDELGEFIQKGAETLFPGLALDVFGPFEAPIYKIKEKYRIRVVIKCRSNAKTRKFLRYIAAEWSSRLSKNATITIDMNPNSL